MKKKKTTKAEDAKELTEEERLKEIEARFEAAKRAKAEEYKQSPQNYEMFW